jgi:hypothetical protein
MPQFQMRWANRSNPGATQDWQLGGAIHDAFQLQPDFVRSGTLNVSNDTVVQIAVTTNQFAAANLTYTASTNTWALASHTPNEFQLQVGNGIVTVRCLLGNAAATRHSRPQYQAQEPKHQSSDPY